MNISKDGKTIFFSDDELKVANDHGTPRDGEKKVYITKRINENEKREKNQKKKNNKKIDLQNNSDNFNFDNEIVIGINQNTKKEKNNNKNKNKKKTNNANKPIKQVKDDIERNKKVNKKNKPEKKTSKFRKKIIASFLGIIGITIAIIVFALVAPIFNITQIDVNGVNHISKQNVINLSGIKIGDNIFKVNKKNIANIKENTYIDSVEFKRILPSTLLINITERTIKYQINLINSYIYIDKNGYILENSTVKKDVPVIIGLKIDANKILELKRLNTEDLEELKNINKVLEAAKSIEIETIISTINIENEDEYIIYIESQNKRIYIGDTNNLTNKMLYIKKILDNEKDKTGSIYVNGNISNGFRPFFREESI